MIYDIKNKKMKVIAKDEIIKLPNDLKEKIKENFQLMKNGGANIWNGKVICVTKCDVTENEVEIICNKSDYAHYLYGERIGCTKEYECKNLSAGCLLETIDGYYVLGELDDNTSYPTMLQVTGGGIDFKDIESGIILPEKTIVREALEELNIDLDNKDLILDNKLSYIYVSEENEQPGVQIFSKAIIKMTMLELRSYYENYYKYLRENDLEREFKKLHFLRKDVALEDLEKLENPKRNYIAPLLVMDKNKI